MDNNSILRDSHRLAFESAEGGSTMVITLRPNYARDFLSFVLALMFAIPLVIASRIPGNSSGLCVWGFIVILLLGLVLQSVNSKRRVKCVIRRNLGTIEYQRSGFLGTPLFARSQDFTVSEIAGFETRDYSRRHFYLFQILIVFKSGERLDLFGSDLGRTEHLTILEEIRDFIGLPLPVKAIGKR